MVKNLNELIFALEKNGYSLFKEKKNKVTYSVIKDYEHDGKVDKVMILFSIDTDGILVVANAKSKRFKVLMSTAVKLSKKAVDAVAGDGDADTVVQHFTELSMANWSNLANP